jgi:hypothetical protein
MKSAAGLAVPAVQASSARAPEPVDFRYAPKDQQSAYCFPDDPHKSLVNQAGSLMIGHAGKGNPFVFPVVAEFDMTGMGPVSVSRQQMEGPKIPIVHTRLEKGSARLELIHFATRRASEGRVDNVLAKLEPAGSASVSIKLHTREQVRGETVDGRGRVFLAGRLFLVANCPVQVNDMGYFWRVSLAATGDILVRLPQAGQTVLAADGGQELLAEARAFWQSWNPFGSDVKWSLPKTYMDFLEACARNILQAREERSGRLTFQVGPTCYRGLWVVDGHFILESARYLGYHDDALAGLDTTWTYQKPSGAVTAGGGEDHIKDTAIAMFSTVRQAELSQRMDLVARRVPEMRKGLEFLKSMRAKGLTEDTIVGRYGLHAMSFGDGGLPKCNEFTNALWMLAGLRAVTGAQPDLSDFRSFHDDYLRVFRTAATREMRRHPQGFDFLPMTMKDDPLWQVPENKWIQLQTGQWALSQAIYPGVVFEPSDPIVRGHVRLMQACTQEEVPIETGWILHGGLWCYNAGFAAHAYLWAGESDWGRRTFHGFLNHATPSWCWREEQPLQGNAQAYYVGDMPHNWASAECVLYLRHMMALEDGSSLRLLEGIGDVELKSGEAWSVSNTPTRFGTVSMDLTKSGSSWQLRYRRGAGPSPASLRLPAALGHRKFASAKGAAARPGGKGIEVDPQSKEWVAIFS